MRNGAQDSKLIYSNIDRLLVILSGPTTNTARQIQFVTILFIINIELTILVNDPICNYVIYSRVYINSCHLFKIIPSYY